ncbi:hypothetical protein [Chloracidobacterium aggregatum]|uniref:hypothetical protein n=1 Tax=Chloracidobacterium aggregatum TaxID=2851959 RepID=UPI0020180780|nr:hypothetical protein [Chloracidobacterium aggregatum]
MAGGTGFAAVLPPLGGWTGADGAATAMVVMLVVGAGFGPVAFISAVLVAAGGVSPGAMSPTGFGSAGGGESVTTRSVDSEAGVFTGETDSDFAGEAADAASRAWLSIGKPASGPCLMSRTLVAPVAGWESVGLVGSVVGTEGGGTLGRMVPDGSLTSLRVG